MANKKRQKLVQRGGARYGSASNYTDVSNAGRQTMAGTARVYKDIWLPAQLWYGQEPDQFANAFDATAVSAGSGNTVKVKNIYGGGAATSPIQVPTLAASCAQDTDANAATAFFAPPDAASSGSVSATLFYTTAGARTIGNIQAWRLNWQYFGTSTSDVGGVSGSLLYAASMVSTGSGKLEIQELGNIASFRRASPFCVLQLKLEGSSASSYAAAPGEQTYGLKLRYIAENIGVVTT